MNSPVPRTNGSSRSIGDILVATGRLSSEDAVRVAQRQQKDNVQFGEAAIALKVLTKDDIDFALSKQFDYSYLSDTDLSLSPDLVAAYKPFSRVGENLRAVRSQLMLRWFGTDPSHKVLAVVSAGRSDGKSFLAGNLAVVFAQQGQRTLLIDGDLRSQPGRGQHGMFKLGKNAGLSGVLAGRAGLEVAQLVPGLPGLAILSSGAVPPNPQELLGRAAFGDLLKIASVQFDIIIVDTPSSEDFADAEIIASRAGAALMVARKNQSMLPQAVQLARRLQEGGVALVGSVLNDA
ncbi:chain length determinant protein tyrosine kinase EpsG [Rhodoferax saidenbachensis]|uniref:Receptor protein-tyrosine kinase n=1 Tax=Rhodoferax saidenbachensis TaxID=1484693 RepID=A0ABU1ZJG0_9BURK|nr:chain length determinant protein tyrosine kinase EpsG [Rhodoferax saidenbachensis]MDR7305618.1 receptor protein-tyrosine kinase [Rhodoferax saidenbachensis]